MDPSWLIWAIGAVLLVLAGFWTSYVARRRSRDLQARSAWASADAALSAARISRDACVDRIEAADDLLSRAELIAADRGGPAAAREVALLAGRAERVWRGDPRDG